MIFHNCTLQGLTSYFDFFQQGVKLAELWNVEIIFNYQLLVSCFWRDLGHFESIIKDVEQKKWKLYRTRDSCIHAGVKVHCTDVLICHCKMDLEILSTSKIGCNVIFFFFESYIHLESVCHPSYSKTVLFSCCGCEWQLNIMCVEEKKKEKFLFRFRAFMCLTAAIKKNYIFKYPETQT